MCGQLKFQILYFYTEPVDKVVRNCSVLSRLTCLPSCPTLVCPLTTVLMLSSSRLQDATSHQQRLKKCQGQKTKSTNMLSLEHFHTLTESSDGFCSPHHRCWPETEGKTWTQEVRETQSMYKYMKIRASWVFCIQMWMWMWQ